MNARGFTLPELLMAIGVASMVVGGLAGISAMAARTQAREYRHGAVATNLTMAMQYITRDFESATSIYTGAPNTNTVLSELSAHANNELCLSRCDPNLDSRCKDAYAQYPSALSAVPQLNYQIYCFRQVTEPDGTKIGKLFRHTLNSSAVNCPLGAAECMPAACTVTCGSGSNAEAIAAYIDSMTVTRPMLNNYYRGIADVRLNGHWSSVSTGTDERIQLKTTFVLNSVYYAGPG